MTESEISFKTSDGVILRGSFFKPEKPQSDRLPCIVMAHGWSCVKEMGLPTIATRLTTALQANCLIYDHRGFGVSKTLAGQPRQEIIPALQCSDIRDAITYAQRRDDVDKDKIGLWGYSYAAGYAMYLAAVDRRIKAVMAVAPMVDGWRNFHRFIPPDVMNAMMQNFEQERLSLMDGNPPTMMPVISSDPAVPASMASRAGFAFFSDWEGKAPSWRNETTVRSLDECYGYSLAPAFADRIYPTPALVVVCNRDTAAPSEVTMECYDKMREPKELMILDADHFDVFDKCLDESVAKQIEFLGKTLCKA